MRDISFMDAVVRDQKYCDGHEWRCHFLRSIGGRKYFFCKQFGQFVVRERRKQAGRNKRIEKCRKCGQLAELG